MSRRMILSAAMAAAMLFALSGPALAEEGETSKKCLQINMISSTKVLDNQHIRFEMKGGPDYLNTLPRKCNGLTKHTPIMYKTSLHELCDLDTITVLHTAGGGYMRGAGCGLGTFVVEEAEEDSGKK